MNLPYTTHDDRVDFRVLSEVYHYTDEGSIDEGFTRVSRIKVSDPTITIRELGDSLYANMYRSCHCEHDCCGHFFGGLTRVKKPTNRKRGEFIVFARYSRNV